MIAYVTDLEGRWDKLAAFLEDNRHVSLSKAGALELADGVTLVYGGDAIDRGPYGRKIVSLLLAARRRYGGDRVVLLAGNRDINKLRLRFELDGAPPRSTPPEVARGPRGALLRWILANTMGAKDAFGHRMTELALDGSPNDDDSVVQSYLDDIDAGGVLHEYLSVARLAYRSCGTLFVHGGVTGENHGAVPESGRANDVDAWVDGLNAFYASEIRTFDAGTRPSALLAYQGPLKGTNYNQQSVVYARPTDLDGNPELPDASTIDWLVGHGVMRVVVGHTPSGDCPALVRDSETGFELLLADNSYGRIERGSKTMITETEVHVDAMTELDDKTRERVTFTSTRSDATSPLGKRDASTGELVKARLASGDYLLFKGLPKYRVEQTRAEPAELESRTLVAPRARDESLGR